MSDSGLFLKLDQPCEQAVAWLKEQVCMAGLSVMRTFDLQVARQAQSQCACPHHGTDQCDCQMVVLLVYQGDRQPVTLVVHGYNGQTEISVVDTPQQRADPALEAHIRQSLVAVRSLPENFRSAHISSDTSLSG